MTPEEYINKVATEAYRIKAVEKVLTKNECLDLLKLQEESFNEKLKEIRNEVEVSSIDQYGISKVLEILDNHIKVNTKQG
jgi:hypothetical protein